MAESKSTGSQRDWRAMAEFEVVVSDAEYKQIMEGRALRRAGATSSTKDTNNSSASGPPVTPNRANYS